MEKEQFELKWQIFKLPKNARCFWVEGTRIQEVWGMLPDPKQHIYKTRNAAKRAVACYRRYSKDYWYSHPDSWTKNISRAMNFAWDDVLKEEKENVITGIRIAKTKTVKIRKLECSGLSDYKRANKK